MTTEQQYFEKALPIKDYMEAMETHKENSQLIYDGFNVPQDDEFITLLNEKNPHILVITEDWCGDAMMNNPILRKVAEAANLEVRCVYRDQNLELMDRWLTNGGRSIPVYLLLNESGDVLTKWGPRAPQLQEYVMNKKKDLPASDDPTFAEKQKELFAAITKENTTNSDFWLWVYEDMRKEFTAALQNNS